MAKKSHSNSSKILKGAGFLGKMALMGGAYFAVRLIEDINGCGDEYPAGRTKEEQAKSDSAQWAREDKALWDDLHK